MDSTEANNTTVRLLVSNLSHDACTVALEPLGGVVTVPKGELVRVEISGPGDGIVEISYAPNGLIVGEWSGASTQVLDQQGEVIKPA